MTGISPEREAQIFARFAEGATTRQVAAEFGIGTGTAARALQRYRDPQDPVPATPEASEPAEPDLTMTDLPVADLDAQLAELHRIRGGLAADAATHEDRAQASRSAVTALEAERLAMLEHGQDAQSLRQRRRDAEDDTADSETAAALVRQRLARVDHQIAGIVARQELAAIRAQLGEAVTARVWSRSGERQAAAVLAVRDAAADFAMVPGDERQADEAVRQLAEAAAAYADRLGEPAPVVPEAVSTALSVPPDVMGGQPLALLKAITQARAGNVPAVCRQLGETFGWLPVSPAELAARGRPSAGHGRAGQAGRGSLAARQAEPEPEAVRAGCPVLRPARRPGWLRRGRRRPPAA
jgi:hypothetical protein